MTQNRFLLVEQPRIADAPTTVVEMTPETFATEFHAKARAALDAGKRVEIGSVAYTDLVAFTLHTRAAYALVDQMQGLPTTAGMQ